MHIKRGKRLRRRVRIRIMRTLQRLLIDLIVFVTIIGTVVFLYRTYSEPVISYFFGEQKVGIYVQDIRVTVAIADTDAERKIGLSGVASLPEREGMLFIFEQEGNYGFWMKDTLIPLDIIWIDDEGVIVHIEENVRPDSYPTIYSSPRPARFVLEVNAFFVSTFRINVGDRVAIPAHKLPPDLHPS